MALAVRAEGCVVRDEPSSNAIRYGKSTSPLALAWLKVHSKSALRAGGGVGGVAEGARRTRSTDAVPSAGTLTFHDLPCSAVHQPRAPAVQAILWVSEILLFSECGGPVWRGARGRGRDFVFLDGTSRSMSVLYLAPVVE